MQRTSLFVACFMLALSLTFASCAGKNEAKKDADVEIAKAEAAKAEAEADKARAEAKKVEAELEMAKAKLEELQSKLEKVKGTPREEEFQMQIDKLNDLIKHLESE